MCIVFSITKRKCLYNSSSFSKDFTYYVLGYVYSGTAHLPVTLLHGKLYYVTIRGITYNGQALQSVTDGIMIDKTPPSVTVDR